MALVAEPLLERDAEIALLCERLDAADRGAGSTVCLEGAAGLGKSSLLAAAAVEARMRGIGVLTARGDELEREYAFGVVRQLFEADVRRRPVREQDELLGRGAGPARAVLGGAPDAEEASGEYARLHALFWLAAELARERPLLLAVDDAQWADLRSLRFLAYLSRRLEGLPLLLLIATRPGADPEVERLLAELGAPGRGTWLRLEPLGRPSVAALVAPGAPDVFLDACESMTGGNPFLLELLAGALRAENVAPDEAGARAVRQLVPESLIRWLLVQLARLPDDARQLARAVAILGDPAELRVAASLAGLSPAAAATAADELARAGILRPGTPLAYIHALVRHAIHEEMPAALRAQQHLAAARLLAEDGAPAERVAAQLLPAERTGDPWAVDVLRTAAREAAARGSREAAGALLLRARDEPPPAELRNDVLVELGAVQEPHAARTTLQQAIANTEDPVRRSALREELAVRLISVAAFEQAIPLLEAALADASEEAAARLDGLLVAVQISRGSVAARRRLLEDSGPRDGDLLLRAARARTLVGSGRRAEELPLLADELGTLETWTGREMMTVSYVANALTWSDELDLADRVWGWTRAEVERLGVLEGLGFVMTFHSFAHIRRGDLMEAEAETRAALELGSGHGWPGGLFTLAMFVELARERGFAPEAWAALREWGVPEEPPPAWPFVYLLESRGRLRIAGGDVKRGLRDVLEAGRRLEGLGLVGVGVSGWRSAAALAHLRLGDGGSAEELATDELARARDFGAARPIGVALRAAGLIAGGAEGRALLEESVAVLARSQARLEHARSLTELGAAMRRGREASAAREHLRTALDLAQRCGATALADQAQTELRATGARPRRLVLSGAASLTPSELRIARHAAEGQGNRDIAQALFVTPRTVENHLTQVYRKLGISSRSEIAAALAEPQAGAV